MTSIAFCQSSGVLKDRSGCQNKQHCLDSNDVGYGNNDDENNDDNNKDDDDDDDVNDPAAG